MRKYNYTLIFEEIRVIFQFCGKHCNDSACVTKLRMIKPFLNLLEHSYMSWLMGARLFPRPGCLVTVIKPMWAWLPALRFSTIHVHMQMAAPTAAISIPLGNGVGTCAVIMHVCPT